MRCMHPLALPALCAAITGLAASCSKPPPVASERPPATVRTAPAVAYDAPVVIEGFGTTADRARVDIMPQVSGVLTRSLIRDGAVVTNGQPMFEIDSRDYAMKVRQAEGLVQADRANLALQQTTLARNADLAGKQLISKQDLDTLRTRVDATRAQLQIDEAGLALAQLQLSRCTICAPLAGICSTREVDEGNLVAAGQTRLTNIRSYDPLFVDFSVPEQHLPLLREALARGPVALAVTTDGDTNAVTGNLAFLDNTVSTQTGTIRLRGEIPNAGLRLWAGQFVRVRVTAGRIPAAVMVPEGAVQFGKQGPYVFVVSASNTAEARPVRTGVRHHDRIQIVDGVVAGEKVVVLGQLTLYPGAAVREAGADQPGHAARPGATAAHGEG